MMNPLQKRWANRVACAAAAAWLGATLQPQAHAAPLARIDGTNYTPTGCLLRTGTGVNQPWRSFFSPRTMA